MSKYDNTPQQLTDLLALSWVPRWSIIPLMRPQSVAEHSHRVSIILMELAFRLDIELPYSVLVWALVHDGPESWSGDIPGPFKHPDQTAQDYLTTPWWKPYHEKIYPSWLKLFKIADLVETGTYIAKFGIGQHAKYAYERILWAELPDAVKKWCLSDETWGSEAALIVVQAVVNNIIEETGRWESE